MKRDTRGRGDDFSAVKFILDETDYRSLCTFYSRRWFGDDCDACIRYKSEPLSHEIIEEENLHFLLNMLNENITGYMLYEYLGSGGADVKEMSGVVVNSETREMLIFMGRDVFPQNPNE